MTLSVLLATLQTPTDQHWTEGLFPSLDFETTGIDNKTARIVTVSAATLAPDNEIVHEYGAIVNPGVDIPEEASLIHGVTTERAQAEGRDPREVLVEIYNWLADVYAAGLPLVIYNAMYDFPLFFHEMDRHNLEYDHALKTIPILDPLVMDRALDRYRKGKRKLTNVAAHYRVDLTQAHEARADSIAAALVLRGMIKSYPNLRKQSLGEMQGLQQKWEREYATRMNQYFTRENIDMKFDTERVWPGV
jgi:DNA polymerase-3 subunit epsilon